jgi:hypothetical protein
MKWIYIKTNEQKSTIDTTICNTVSRWFSPVSAIFNGNKDEEDLSELAQRQAKLKVST